MSCHIIWLHMKYPELFMGVRACHPSTSQWTERVVLFFFCPAGGGRVPWSKVWRCRGLFKKTGRNIQPFAILTSQTVALDHGVSWDSQIIMRWSSLFSISLVPALNRTYWTSFFLDVLGFHSLVAAFPRRSSMVMKQHARVLTREKPMWNSWAGRTAGWVFHGISWYFSCKVTSPLWIRREKSKILYKWRICMFLAGKIPEGNGGILEGSYGNHHVYTYNNK